MPPTRHRAALFTFRDGLIVRVDGFTDRAEALKAAGAVGIADRCFEREAAVCMGSSGHIFAPGTAKRAARAGFVRIRGRRGRELEDPSPAACAAGRNAPAGPAGSAAPRYLRAMSECPPRRGLAPDRAAPCPVHSRPPGWAAWGEDALHRSDVGAPCRYVPRDDARGASTARDTCSTTSVGRCSAPWSHLSR